MVGQPAPAMSRMVAPPVTYAGVYNSGSYIRFSEGTSPGNLRIHYRNRIARVNINYAAVTGVAMTTMFVAGVSVGNTLYLCPANKFYTPGPLQVFAALFNRWRMENCCWEFVPRTAGGTSSGISVTWGWSNDPVHPDTHGWAFTGGAGWIPTEAQVGTLPNATQFPAWIPQQCLRVKRQDPKWLFSAASNFGNNVDITDVVADVRDQYPGFLTMAGDENATGPPSTTVVVGQIYMEGTFEFSELTSTITTDPSLMGLMPKARERKVREEPEEKRSTSRTR
jgi:hypothetical protein